MTRELINAIMILLGIFSAGLGLKGSCCRAASSMAASRACRCCLAMVTGPPLAFWLPSSMRRSCSSGTVTLARHSRCEARRHRRRSRWCSRWCVPDVTHDRPLDAVFGGFFLGAGIGLAVRGGAVSTAPRSRRSDQQAQHAAASRRRHPRIQRRPVCRRDGRARSRGGALFDPHVPAAARTLDFVIHGIEEYTAMTIVSGGARRFARLSPASSAAA